MEELNDITETLEELMSSSGLSNDKLAELTDIPKRFINSLTSGQFDKLPARPYIRGYLFKIAQVLKVDPYALWQNYMRSADVYSSGMQDKLPSNRFAFKKIRAKRIVAIFTIILVLGFAGLRLNDILGKPTLNVSVPETTSNEIITINGSVDPGDQLTLNGEVIYPDQNGDFKKDVQLESGINTLSFRVKHYLGKETILIKRVLYQPNNL